MRPSPISHVLKQFPRKGELVHRHALPQDALPPPIKGWPTPWINRSEYQSYLSPLLSRGWSATYHVHQQSTSVHNPSLTGSFLFSSFGHAGRFINDILWLSTTEKHHPNLSLTPNPTGGGFHVQITSQTHSATPHPSWDLESPSVPHQSQAPGITARDVRFAWMLSRSYSNISLGDSKITAPEEVVHVPNWEEYKRWLWSDVSSPKEQLGLD